MLLLGSDTFTVMMDEDGSELSLWAGSRSIIRTGHRQSERAWRVCRRLAGYFDESRVRSNMHEDRAVGHDIWRDIERADSEAMLQAWCGRSEPEHVAKRSARVAGFRGPSAFISRLLSVVAKTFTLSR